MDIIRKYFFHPPVHQLIPLFPEEGDLIKGKKIEHKMAGMENDPRGDLKKCAFYLSGKYRIVPFFIERTGLTGCPAGDLKNFNGPVAEINDLFRFPVSDKFFLFRRSFGPLWGLFSYHRVIYELKFFIARRRKC